MDIHGSGMGPINPQDKKLYTQQYKHGIDLFQRALDGHATAGEVHKKDAFKKVMDQALNILNETARGLKDQKLLEQNAKIEQDYNSYRHSETGTEKDKLISDLNQAGKEIK